MSDFETNEEDNSDHTNKEKEDAKIAFKRLKKPYKYKPYIWTDARKEAFNKMIETKRLNDSNKKIKKKQDNEIKKEILQTSRKQLKEKIKKSNIDELKSKVNIEDELIEETTKNVIKNKKTKTKYYK